MKYQPVFSLSSEPKSDDAVVVWLVFSVVSVVALVADVVGSVAVVAVVVVVTVSLVCVVDDSVVVVVSTVDSELVSGRLALVVVVELSALVFSVEADDVP